MALRHRLGGFRLDVAFAAPAGRHRALRPLRRRQDHDRQRHRRAAAPGRSAGSSPTARVLLDTAAGLFVPRHRRRIGYVFQEGRLFPHSQRAAEPRLRPLVRAARRAAGRFGHVVELLGIGHLLDRRPAGLSGGEKQRVAIGRALLASPRLLLMDEPLASLDAARKDEILPYLERLRDEVRVPILYVSHAIAEVARLATTVVALADGRVVLSGPAPQVLSDPALFPAPSATRPA